MPPKQALEALLAGTGISVRMTGVSTATLVTDNGADAGATVEGAIALDTIDVSGGSSGRDAASGSGFMGTPDWVYETPAAVSVVSREAIKNAAGARDPRDLLDNVAGAYVNSSVANSPAISPNIRGVQDMGRVVVSIDGARQNANRTITAGGDSYVGSSGKAFVDPAFIRGVEVERSTGAKAGLAGSLAGAVTFRTVEADDLIEPGRDWGVETNTTFGTNNQHFTGSILGATRLTDTPFSVVAGLSRQSLGEYEVGSHGSVEWTGEETGETTLMGRNNWSSLLKLEGDFGEVTTAIAWTHQEKKFAWIFGGRSDEAATVDTGTAKLDWAPADNNLIDLNAKVWLNNTQEDTLRYARGDYADSSNTNPQAGYPDSQIDADFLSFGASIDNTSRFDTDVGGVTLNYGAEAFRDRADSSATNEAIEAWPELESNFTSFSPSGRRDTASPFLNGDWKPAEWVTLSAGLRYDWYRLKGSPTYYDIETTTTDTTRSAQAVTTYGAYLQAYLPDTYAVWSGRCNDSSLSPTSQAAACDRLAVQGEIVDRHWYKVGSTIGETITTTTYPATTLDIDRSGGKLLPSASIEFKPVDWFRPYASYSQSYRPPSIAETFLSGALPGIEEPGRTYAPNESLRPETAETWEIGANVIRDGILTEQDQLRLKLSAFDRKIDDYIVVGYFYTSETSRQYTGYLNATGVTRMRGVELEGNYDTGRYWIGGSATWLDTKWPDSVQGTWYGQVTYSDNIQMFASGAVPPKFKGALDVGVRLVEQRLELGARVTHVTPTLTQLPTIGLDGQYLTSEYTKLDLYGTFAITDKLTLRANLDNVTDVNHVPAGSVYPAPGRTFYATLNSKF